jgi:hypothetical protein
MEKQLGAWRANVQTLLAITEKLPAGDRRADGRQLERLQALIQDTGRVTDLLRHECLPA